MAVLCLSGVTGCAPAAMLPLAVASSVLGGGGNNSSVLAGPGPFGSRASPVQNRSPASPAINDALAAAKQELVSAACKAKLPPAKPAPTTGCVTQPTCLPGASAPVPLRLCAEITKPVPLHSLPTDTSAWKWGDHKKDARSAHPSTGQNGSSA